MKKKGLLALVLSVAVLLIILFYFQSAPAETVETYEVYFRTPKSEEWCIICEEASNVRSSGVLSINFYGTSGPTDFEMLVEYKSPGSESYNLSTSFSLSLDHGASISIPAGTDYRIHAKAISGEPGYASFQIALS